MTEMRKGVWESGKARVATVHRAQYQREESHRESFGDVQMIRSVEWPLETSGEC